MAVRGNNVQGGAQGHHKVTPPNETQVEGSTVCGGGAEAASEGEQKERDRAGRVCLL